MRGKTTEQLSLADGFLDPSFFELDEELKKVDELLSNRGFLQPFEAVFDETMGRPGTPVDVYLRMMYLKFRWGLGYDIGLIHQTVRTLTRTVKRLGVTITDHTRATKKALARLGASLKSKRGQKKERAQKALKSVKRLAEDTLSQCRSALVSLKKKSTGSCGHTGGTIERFTEQIKLGGEIVEQTEQKLDGVESIPERIVSFHDPEARVIRKGKMSKPNEFGRTVQLVQDESGVIVHHEVHEGNPSDKKEIAPLVKDFKKEFHHAPTEVTADKGYYSEDVIEQLSKHGVRKIGIPKIGRLDPHERRRQKSRWFKTLQRFRCAIEAGISMLKRQFHLDRCLSHGTTGTKIWVGFSILAYNLWQMT